VIALTFDSLDPRAVEAQVAGPDAGGLATFQGVARNENQGRAVTHLEYEAYAEMAIPAMEAIAAEAAQRWPGVRVAMVHRLGRVEVGEPSVVVAVAAAHRAEAFAACRFAIDSLKSQVPIWKKEYWLDGSHWVEGARARSGHAGADTSSSDHKKEGGT
jgi:molybdopterin synthase catalytic subunit